MHAINRPDNTQDQRCNTRSIVTVISALRAVGQGHEFGALNAYLTQAMAAPPQTLTRCTHSGEVSARDDALRDV